MSQRDLTLNVAIETFPAWSLTRFEVAILKRGPSYTYICDHHELVFSIY